MGSNQFQKEYIEYLEKCNSELLNRINNIKESYENRILSKDLNNEYLISTLEDVLNIFTVMPQEIDLFFEKISAALETFRNILLRKSEMLRLMDRISKVLNTHENLNKLGPIDDQVLRKNPESIMGKKGGIVKVSPMINGHIISTEPRIYLSRVPGVFTSRRRSETHQLSPIIETSPDTSPDPSSFRCHVLKEIKIPLERININKMSYNYRTEKQESPKTRFKGPKLWKKSLSSNKLQSDYQRKSIFSENNENLNQKISLGEDEIPEKSESVDPLEGPSWLYEDNSEINSSSNHFINYRRRKHRFATVFDKGEDCYAYVEKEPKKSSKPDDIEFDENKAKYEEEDIEEIKERLSEGSEDFISTSLSSDGSENCTPYEKTRPNKRRDLTKQSGDEKVIAGVDTESKKETSREKSEKRRTISSTPVYSDSSDEEDIERKKLKVRSIKNRKSSRKELKSLRGRISTQSSFERTSKTPESVKRETRKSKRDEDSKRRNTPTKIELENGACDAQLNDCLDEEKMLPKRLKISEKTKSKKSKSKSKSRSPGIVLQENEGRMKRKAAPTKLIEPALNTKLRRN